MLVYDHDFRRGHGRGRGHDHDHGQNILNSLFHLLSFSFILHHQAHQIIIYLIIGKHPY
jgi:hypothetical protein